jgi:guanylate kinase
MSNKPAPAAEPNGTPLVLVLSAPSGGGKTTLCQQLLAANASLVRAVTCTTRPPRTGEKNGVDYYFLDAAVFQQHVAAGDFLEHATVYGFSYGTLKGELLGKLREGKDVLLVIDVQGAAAVRARAHEDPELARALVTVFLTPPTLKELEARLRKRGTESEAIRQKRLSVARQEIAQWSQFDYLVLSGAIAEDVRRTQAIIEAEKMRSSRVRTPLGD